MLSLIYINNWIADKLFAKQPTSEATEWPRPVLPWIVNYTSTSRQHVGNLFPAQVSDVLALGTVNSNRESTTLLDHKKAYKNWLINSVISMHEAVYLNNSLQRNMGFTINNNKYV